MNERIRELAKEAEAYADYYAIIADEPEKDIFVRRFAELLILECMELTHWKDFDMSVEQRIRLSVYQDIKEHFGVG